MNAYEKLLAAADKVGWNTDSKVRVLCEYLDKLMAYDHSLVDGFERYLAERVREEEEHGNLAPLGTKRAPKPTTRGVKILFRVERPCDCICHKRAGVKHIVACCYAPKTEEGKQALKNYKA